MPQLSKEGPEEERRALWAGLSSIGGNCFWQWLRRQMEERRAYLQQRLVMSADWSEFRFTGGQLEALNQLLRQIEEIENTMQRRDEDDVL
ncbi:MAG: hypothetical protein J6T26_04425 [Firmicutes bacterium]|nr:hypothetical protein [Bacillota bacterium]